LDPQFGIAGCAGSTAPMMHPLLNPSGYDPGEHVAQYPSGVMIWSKPQFGMVGVKVETHPLLMVSGYDPGEQVTQVFSGVII